MSYFNARSINVIIFLSAVLLITSCANVGDKSADINECGKIAYGDHNDSLDSAAEDLYSQCKAKKDALRAKANKNETRSNWVQFFWDLFVPSHSTDNSTGN